jgi:hypothetical protein
MTKDFTEFCYKYDAYVVPSTKMHRRVRRVDYKIWASDQNIYNNNPYEDVTCVEIHMPEDRFRALMEHDQWLEEKQHAVDLKRDIQEIVHKLEEETRLRHQHPGLQDLWQQYQTMLNLVR